tara:strand:- start:17 stop:166 length:150 start_codon:yes stop_codon:yes gene_type:complete
MSGDYKTYDEEAEPFKVSHAFRVKGVKKGVCTPDGTLITKLAIYRGEEE